jgi:hypothetical protein
MILQLAEAPADIEMKTHKAYSPSFPKELL